MATYLVPLAVIASFSLLAVVLPWRWETLPWGIVGGVLGAVLLAAELSWWAVLALRPGWTAATGLPLELCDITALVGAVALWWRRMLLVELLWFWGVAGGLLAILTPELPAEFPSWLFLQYGVVHGGIVVAPLLLTVGLRVWPRPGAVWRVGAVTLGYALCVGLVNIVSGGNYLWLRHPPTGPDLLDLLGPWPWYLGLDSDRRLRGTGRAAGALRDRLAPGFGHLTRRPAAFTWRMTSEHHRPVPVRG